MRPVHGSPRRINEYLFEDRDERSLERVAAAAESDVLVFGHTHKPWSRTSNSVVMVNAGSVGKPKDRDRRAAGHFWRSPTQASSGCLQARRIRCHGDGTGHSRRRRAAEPVR